MPKFQDAPPLVKREKSKSEHPRVDHIRYLLGDDALLLHWPLGKKATDRPWGKLTAAEMDKPAYLRKLETGNIGVALGEKSGHVCSIDLDDDQVAEEFLAVNENLRDSLRTRGARGCNIWVRLIGDYPRTTKLKNAHGDEIGEWRANGVQTIISGRHPDGPDYQILVEARPNPITYTGIKWPDSFVIKPAKRVEPIAHSDTGTQETQGTQATQGSQKQKERKSVVQPLSSFSCSSFIPTARHHGDGLLWRMSGSLKTWELRKDTTTTVKERTAIFNEWWQKAEPHTDPNEGYHAYLEKWLRNCETRVHPDDPVTAAWHAALTEPLPPEATADRDFPMPAKMQQLVALCWQLQRINGDKPFFLTCRMAGALIGAPFKTVNFWLNALSREGGQLRVLRKVAIGSLSEHRANEWRYIRQEDGALA